MSESSSDAIKSSQNMIRHEISGRRVDSLNVKELKRKQIPQEVAERNINRVNEPNKPSLIKRLRNILAAATVTAAVGGTVADVAVGDPVGDALSSGGTVATRSTEVLADYSNLEVSQFNEKANSKLTKAIPLDHGEKIQQGIEIVPAANNFEDLQKAQNNPVGVYAAPYGIGGMGKPIGTVNPGDKFSGDVLTIPNQIRPDSNNQRIDYKFGEIEYTNTKGEKITGKIWIPGYNGVQVPPPGTDTNPAHY